MELDFSRLLPPFGIGMLKDIHLIHILIVASGLLLGYFTFKYLSRGKERFKIIDIIALIIIGIPVTYFIGFCLALLLYPFELEQADISQKQFAFTSFYFMLFSTGSFIYRKWYH